MTTDRRSLTPYLEFDRFEWARLRDATPLPLTEEDIGRLRGLNEPMSLEEVEAIYLPLSRLLNLHVAAAQQLHRASNIFLGETTRVPYIVGMAGSVAAGKSTTARVLRELLSRWPDHPRVAIITTDGFLYPNVVLQARGLMERKGFPESYDVRALLEFLAELKSGRSEVRAPVYSHLVYDVLPGDYVAVDRPDIVIVEGLNVLQGPRATGRPQSVLVSDYFDFSIYVDASEIDIERWYVERFLLLRETAFRNPDSYFRRYAELTEEEARETALSIWRRINAVNLVENILPTRERADLILSKGPDHAVQHVRLRKV